MDTTMQEPLEEEDWAEDYDVVEEEIGPTIRTRAKRFTSKPKWTKDFHMG
jgi:hypothetical protein